MTSEIRANTLKNRVGLGTVSFTNTGPVVSGIVTIANSTAAGVRLEDNAGVGGSLKITTPSGYVSIGAGNAAFVHLNTDRGSYYFQKRIIVDEGIIGSYDEDLTLQSPLNTNRVTINKDTGLFSILNDLDVDGHTNLDNVSIAGVTTAIGQLSIGAAPSSGLGLFNIKPSSGDEYFKVRDAGDFDSALNGIAVDIRNSANNTSKDFLVRSQTLVLWQSGAEKLRIKSDGTIEVKDSAVNLAGNAPSVKGKIRIGGVSNSTTAGGIEFHTSSGGGGGYGTRITSDASANMHFLTRSNSVNWSESLRIKGSNGYVGIATNNPQDLLHIQGSSDTTLRFTGNQIKFYRESGSSFIDQYGAGDISFRTTSSNVERLRIKSDGKFGVGDFTSGTAVSQAFHVKGSQPEIYLEHTGGYDLTLTTNDGSGQCGINPNGGALSLAYNNKNIWMCRTGGYVSIGHNSPSTRLDVRQDNGVAYNGRAQTVAYGVARFLNTSGHTSGGTYTGFQFNITGNSQNRICAIGMISEATNNRSSSLVFATDDSGNRTEKLRITSGGQVVVGGTSSQASDAVTLMPDGEVTAAGFYFSNNIGSAMNNTGIRRATTNTMVFDTASTERLRIDADGNTSTKGSNLEHFVNKRVQAIAQNGNYVQYVLICPTGTNDVRLQGKFHFTRASGTSGNAQQTVEAQLMTNNTGGDAQYYVRTTSTDQGAYAGMYYRWVTCTYNSTTYYALEGHPISGSSYWGGFMQHGVFTGTANACSNLGTVLNTGSHSISNITALTTRKAHERWYNTNLNVQAGALYVKQGSGLQGGYFAPLYYDTNGAALPTQMKVHGQKAVCIDCTRYYTSGDIITFRINNDYEGAIYVNPSGVQYNTTSDYRLKENVIDLTGAIDRVKQLKPKRFNFIKDPGNTMDGFMAHEVSSVVPNAVVGEKDAVKDILYEENDEVIPEGKKIGDVKEKDAIDPQSMDDSKLVPLLTAALQEAIAKIETLETKVAALEG